MTAPAPRVLVVDDDMIVRESTAALLECEGFRVRQCRDVESALSFLGESAVDAVLTDLEMPGGDGLGLVTAARRRDAPIPVLVFTGVGTVSRAVEAMKAGAYDFLEKPVDPDRLIRLLRHALEKRQLLDEIKQLRRDAATWRDARRLVGDSETTRKLLEQVERVAPTEASVLIVGETGTGKELVAEAIHAASPRKIGPRVRVNCAAIPEGLFESEFFGHRRGSFSGAIADRIGRFEESEGGTLILDEIGTLTAEGQAKLLRVLEGGEYQVVGDSRTRHADSRIIAVTNEDLGQRVAEGSFRADLFYRLEVYPIHVAPLRERPDDLPAIAAALLDGLASAMGGRAEPLDDEAIGILRSYSWPGNVRELRNALERALIASGGDPLDAKALREAIDGLASRRQAFDATAASPEGNLREHLDRVESEQIRIALEQTGGRKKEAAERLGIDPRNFSYYLKKHGLDEARAQR